MTGALAIDDERDRVVVLRGTRPVGMTIEQLDETVELARLVETVALAKALGPCPQRVGVGAACPLRRRVGKLRARLEVEHHLLACVEALAEVATPRAGVV